MTTDQIEIGNHIDYWNRIIGQCGTATCLTPAENAKIRRAISSFKDESNALQRYCERFNLRLIPWDFYSESWTQMATNRKFATLTMLTGTYPAFPIDARLSTYYATQALAEVRTLSALAMRFVESRKGDQDLSTFLANIKHAIRNKDTVVIGGGEFSHLELARFVNAIESLRSAEPKQENGAGSSPWSVKQSDDNDYLYISRSGYPGEIHVKAEAEGFVVDAWQSGNDSESVATMAVMSADLEPVDAYDRDN